MIGMTEEKQSKLEDDRYDCEKQSNSKMIGMTAKSNQNAKLIGLVSKKPNFPLGFDHCHATPARALGIRARWKSST